MAKQEPYPSTLTDKEWRLIEPWLRPASKLGRPPRYSRRLMLDAILYVVRSGCTWRMLPHEFPHWRLVYYYFARWQQEGRWECLQRVLVEKVRVQHGEKKAPTAAIIDSQSVKMAGQPGERGFDAGKKIMGRKRHLLVDTLGLILGVVVHPASVQDRDGAKLLQPFLLLYGWLKTVFVDGGYAGQLAQWMAELPRHRHLQMQVVKRPQEAKGFILLPKRWVVERTFAWLGNFRRLAKDYEVKTAHSEAVIYVCSAHLLARRLARAKLP